MAVNSSILIGLGVSSSVADNWVIPINTTFEMYYINTTLRQQHFLAQILHESARLSALKENLNYSAQSLLVVWPSRFDSVSAQGYARNPQMIANHVYANRMGNGDEASGDGWKYCGRGLIMVTGKSNYQACGQELGIDLVSNPDQLIQPLYASESAGWFWNNNNLNDLADKDDILSITKRINGGTNGLQDRQSLLVKAKQLLK